MNDGCPPPEELVIRVVAMPKDANANGDIFGGWLMSLMDSGCGMLASRHARSRVVTVAMDGMQFHRPVAIGDEVSVYAWLVKVGRTSMVIDAEAWRRQRDEEKGVKVTQARFTFVAIDEDHRPHPVLRD